MQLECQTLIGFELLIIKVLCIEALEFLTADILHEDHEENQPLKYLITYSI